MATLVNQTQMFALLHVDHCLATISTIANNMPTPAKLSRNIYYPSMRSTSKVNIANLALVTEKVGLLSFLEEIVTQDYLSFTAAQVDIISDSLLLAIITSYTKLASLIAQGTLKFDFTTETGLGLFAEVELDNNCLPIQGVLGNSQTCVLALKSNYYILMVF